MKFCTYDDGQAGVVADDKVYPVGAAMVAAGILKEGYTMVQVIEAMTGNPDAPGCVDECVRAGDSVPLDQVTLRAPIDNPTSLWAAAANYMDHRKEMETRMGGGHTRSCRTRTTTCPRTSSSRCRPSPVPAAP